MSEGPSLEIFSTCNAPLKSLRLLARIKPKVSHEIYTEFSFIENKIHFNDLRDLDEFSKMGNQSEC